MENGATCATPNSKNFWERHPTFTKAFFTFCVIAACITFYFALLRIDVVKSALSKVVNIFDPILYGVVFAFLLNPLVKSLENLFIKLSSKKGAKEFSKKKKSAIRSISILIAIFIAGLIMYLMASFLFPELVESLANISKTLPKQIDSFSLWASHILANNKFFYINPQELISSATDHLTNWLQTSLTKRIDVWLGFIKSGLASTFRVVFNVVIGFACSIYMMFNREKFLAQCKKILYALLKPEKAITVMKFSKNSLEIFTHSIIGKIIDSVILGFICFAGVKILNIPYPVLISVIIGITNVIPFFGPWLGAIPCAILVLLTNPIQVIYFGLFVLALQQFDANFLTPKIVGEYIGLPAFWVLVSCLVGGGFYGIVGLILGPPVLAIFYQLFSSLISYKLKDKELPPETSNYLAGSEVLENTIKPQPVQESKDE